MTEYACIHLINSHRKPIYSRHVMGATTRHNHVLKELMI